MIAGAKGGSPSDEEEGKLERVVEQVRKRREYWDRTGELPLGRALGMMGRFGWTIVGPALPGAFLKLAVRRAGLVLTLIVTRLSSNRGPRHGGPLYIFFIGSPGRRISHRGRVVGAVAERSYNSDVFPAMR